MKIRKRTRRVTVETERTFVYRSRCDREIVWCVACAMNVEMLSVNRAAREVGLSELTVYQLVESGALHYAEDAEGRVLVCLNALRQ